MMKKLPYVYIELDNANSTTFSDNCDVLKDVMKSTHSTPMFVIPEFI